MGKFGRGNVTGSNEGALSGSFHQIVNPWAILFVKARGNVQRALEDSRLGTIIDL